MNISKLIVSLFLGVLIGSCSMTEQPGLVNPDASKKAVNLYSFIQEIQGNYTLTGQHNFINSGSKYSGRFEKITGKHAIVWGSDFSWCVLGEDAQSVTHRGCGILNISEPDTSFMFLNVDMAEVRQNLIT